MPQLISPRPHLIATRCSLQLERVSAVAVILTARLWEAHVNCSRQEVIIVFLFFGALTLFQEAIVVTEFFIRGPMFRAEEFSCLCWKEDSECIFSRIHKRCKLCRMGIEILHRYSYTNLSIK